MILTTQTDRLGIRLGDEKAVEILCRAGFDALDYSMFGLHNPEHPLNGPDFESYVQNLKKKAAAYGVTFRQAHAPFPSCRENDEDYNQVTFTRIVRAMEVVSVLGARIIVVHPTCISRADEMKQYNLDFYRRLQPYCEKLGVKVALENMWGRDKVTGRICPNVCSTGKELCGYIDELDSRYFTVCLDLGHCGLVGEDAADMVRTVGHDRLKALHVHDNDNASDSHTAPYFGKMNWDSITQALADIRYDGDFTFEADRFYDLFPDSLLPSAAKFLHDIGRSLISMIESKS